MGKRHPAFEPMQGPSGWFWFRRAARNDWLRAPRPVEDGFNHLVVYGHSIKERCFAVHLYSGVLPEWNRRFGRHLLASSTGLPNVRLGTMAVPATAAIYRHDGTESGAVAALEQIAEELAAHALPWFRETVQTSETSVLAQRARMWLLEHWAELTDDVADKMAAALRAADDRAWHVDCPPLQSLKNDLRTVADERDLSFAERQQISPLARDALEYAQYRKKPRPASVRTTDGT